MTLGTSPKSKSFCILVENYFDYEKTADSAAGNDGLS